MLTPARFRLGWTKLAVVVAVATLVPVTSWFAWGCGRGEYAAHPATDSGVDAGSDVDGSGPSIDATSDVDGGYCAFSEVQPHRAGVDIVFIIDNSHSMGDEITKTLANINQFAQIIANSGLDYQVIMLSAKGTNLTDMSEDVPNLKGSSLTGDMPLEVCVPPPLGIGEDGGCGDNAPDFHHLDHWPVGIASHNGMWMAINMYQQEYTWVDDAGPPGGGWRQWARFDATKYFIIISDDDAHYPDPAFGDAATIGTATEPWDVFDKLILNDERFGPPGMFGDEQQRKYVYNAVVGWVYPDGGSLPPEQGGGCVSAPGTDYNWAQSPGEQHQLLAQLTGGIVDSICKEDWTAVLGNLADVVVSTIGCEYLIPVPEAGTIDPQQVAIQYTPQGGEPQLLIQVTDQSKCGQYPDAWYYDDNTSPSKVILCPQACSSIGASETGQVDLLFGCATPPPK